jgi:hypothetical protein
MDLPQSPVIFDPKWHFPGHSSTTPDKPFRTGLNFEK